MSANRLIVKLVKQSFSRILLSIALSFSGAIFNGIGITLVIPLILILLGIDIVESDNFPPILSKLFSVFDGVPEQYRVLAMISTVVFTIVLKNITIYANTISSGLLNRRFTESLRTEGARLLLDVDIQYFSGVKLGELMNYLNIEVNRASTAVRALVKIIGSSITIFVFLVILLLISWKLTLIATTLLGIVAYINQISIKYSKVAGQELSAAAASLSTRTIEVLSGIRLVKSLANEEVEYDAVEQLIRKREYVAFKSQLIFASVGPVNEVSSIFSVIALVMIGRGLFTDQIQVFSSIIITYLFILTRMLPFIGQLNQARNQIANSAASIEILENFLNRENKEIMQSGDRLFEGLKYEIKFKDLWFRYPASDGWTLQNIDLLIPKGHTVALVGASGAGKSTMADMLARFYDPVKGVIEIDGVDLREFDVHQYRRKIGIVSQDTFLFNASIGDNLAYGYSSVTDEDVYQAATRANAVEFIQDLPKGFDTQIGDRGVLLSGGQRQRLAIARALLKNPEILILDEATSALDTVSERLVQQALENLSKDRTTLVIAHRLSTVQKANQIVVLDKGQIVEVGTHQELLENGSHYAKLYAMQFSENADSNVESANDIEKGQINNYLAKDFSHASYEIRSQLSSILGLLGLLNEDLLDTPEDYEELTEQTYHSAFNILQSLEKLERQF